MRRLAALVAAAALLVTGCSGSKHSASPSPEPTYTAPPPDLPVNPVPLTTNAPPWAPPVITNAARSADYVAAAGLPYAPEMLRVHYHAHLDINVDGKAVAVPPYIGFVAKGRSIVGLAPLHTHLQDGIIHIENSVPAKFVLDQFFIEWGVRFTATCLGPYCTGHGKELAVFVDGKRLTGDPTQLVLAKHQEIAIEYGRKGALPTPPSSFSFPNGL